MEKIIEGALSAAEQYGYNRVTLQQIADAAGVSKQLPIIHFKTMQGLRRKIMREAVARGRLALIAQGLALKDPHALKAPAELRAAAVATL